MNSKMIKDNSYRDLSANTATFDNLTINTIDIKAPTCLSLTFDGVTGISQSSSRTIYWNNTSINQGDFVLLSSSSTITIPKTGIYQISYNIPVKFNGNSTNKYIGVIQINNIEYQNSVFWGIDNSASVITLSSCRIFNLNSNDIVKLKVKCTDADADGGLVNYIYPPYSAIATISIIKL